MVPTQQTRSRNTLIRALSADGHAALGPHLHRVELQGGERIATGGTAIESVWFPESAVASCMEVLGKTCAVEIGMVGYEGLVGWPLLLETDASMHDVAVHVGGTALRAEARAFASVCARVPAVAALFRRYVANLTVQIGRTAMSNLRDPVERRLSRWLLMCHDRLDGDEIDLTHKNIATTLGVRRASVTDGLHNLEGEHVISNRRGHIVISDRRKLERLAGESYGHAEAHYTRTIAPFGKTGEERSERRPFYVREPDQFAMLIPAGSA